MRHRLQRKRRRLPEVVDLEVLHGLGFPVVEDLGHARAVVVAATDPANPYGGALAWPVRDEERGHKPARKAGALVVLVDGSCVLYVERGGRTLLSFTDEPARLTPAVDALALAVRDGALGKLTVEKADGEPALTSTLGLALEEAGFRPTPRGLRLRA